MKSKNLKPTLYLLSTVLGLSMSGFAEKPTDKQYWARTEMNFQFLQQNILDCRGSKLVACIQALNVGAAEMSPPAIFATDREAAQKIPSIGKRLKSFGAIGLFELIEDKSKASLREKLQRAQSARKLQIDSINELVKKGVKVNIGSILAATKSEMLSQGADGEAFLAGMMTNTYLAAALDPHTHIDPTEQVQDSMKEADDSFSGIGVVIQQTEGRTIIRQMMEGGQALASGVRSNDVLLAIDDVLIAGKDTDFIIGKIKGPEGTTVTLSIERNGVSIKIPVRRAKVLTPNVSSKLVSDMGIKMGYIKLNSFMDRSGCDKVSGAITDLTRQGAQALILDLRGNGGGLLPQATCIGGLFVGKRVIVEEKTTRGDLIDSLSGDGDAVTDLPMATLIDSYSASASEIVSGALQDYQRSLIVGDRSFGKATVQQVRSLTEHLNIAQTIARFYQPSGRTNQVVGISPDFSVDIFPGATDDEKFTMHESDLYTNAFPALGKPWVQTRPEYINRISDCMKSGAQAENQYKQHKEDAIQPDFRLFSAEEALACAAALGT